MSNKVGILTIHSVYNYGAMLQAFALSKYLKSEGFETEVIDYRPYFLCRNYEFYFRDLIISPRTGLGVLKQSIVYKEKFVRFNKFLKDEIPLSKKRFENYKALRKHNYDTLVTGSDQIWNPFITGWDQSYLLSFDTKNTNKLAYSSSFGVTEIPDEWSTKVKKSLSDFSSLGVREQSGCNIIKDLLPSKNVSLVLDPVFLLSADYWKQLADHALTPKTKYLLIYSLEVNKKIIEYAKIVAREMNLKILTIHPFKADYDFADICINNAGPKEFISLVDNAKFVVTNSFHGIAFSILLNKKFAYVQHSKTGTRMSSLLDRVELKSVDYKLKRASSGVPMYEMDFKSNKLLKLHIEKSKECLALGNTASSSYSRNE